MQHTIYISEELEELMGYFRSENRLSFNKAISVMLWRGFKNPTNTEYAEALEAIKTYRAKLDAFNENRQEMDKI